MRRDKNVQLVCAMLQAKLSGKELAAATNISKPTISKMICRRVDPKPETIKAVCRVLNKTAAELGLVEVGS